MREGVELGAGNMEHRCNTQSAYLIIDIFGLSSCNSLQTRKFSEVDVSIQSALERRNSS